jgi:hypothetical protein
MSKHLVVRLTDAVTSMDRHGRGFKAADKIAQKIGGAGSEAHPPHGKSGPIQSSRARLTVARALDDGLHAWGWEAGRWTANQS